MPRGDSARCRRASWQLRPAQAVTLGMLPWRQRLQDSDGSGTPQNALTATHVGIEQISN